MGCEYLTKFEQRRRIQSHHCMQLTLQCQTRCCVVAPLRRFDRGDLTRNRPAVACLETLHALVPESGFGNLQHIIAVAGAVSAVAEVGDKFTGAKFRVIGVDRIPEQRECTRFFANETAGHRYAFWCARRAAGQKPRTDAIGGVVRRVRPIAAILEARDFVVAHKRHIRIRPAVDDVAEAMSASERGLGVSCQKLFEVFGLSVGECCPARNEAGAIGHEGCLSMRKA